MRHIILALPLMFACSSSDGSTSDALCAYGGSYDIKMTPQAGQTCNAPADTDVWTMRDMGDGTVGIYFAGAPNACESYPSDGCKLDVACVSEGTTTDGKPRRVTISGSVAVADGLSGSMRVTLRDGEQTCFVDYAISGTRK